VWRSDAGFNDISVHNLHSGATGFDRIPWISYNFQGLETIWGSIWVNSGRFQPIAIRSVDYTPPQDTLSRSNRIHTQPQLRITTRDKLRERPRVTQIQPRRPFRLCQNRQIPGQPPVV